MKTIFTSLILFFLSFNTFGQLEKKLYQTFDLEGIDLVELDLIGDITTETWPGTALMIESNIELYNSNHKMLKYFVDSGRYKVIIKVKDYRLKLASKDKERKIVRTDSGLTEEVVTLKIFIPDSYDIQSNTKFVKQGAKLPEEATAKGANEEAPVEEEPQVETDNK